MRLICGIDFETEGLDCKEHRVVEIGACLWDRDTNTPLTMLSCFVNQNRPLSPEITALTGITDEQIDIFGISEEHAFSKLEGMMTCADYAMAHNAAFDRGFFLAAMDRLGWEGEPGYDMKWICSKDDIKYPPEITTRSLKHLAAERSFLNPFSHRALFDVLTMFKVASSFSWDETIARANDLTLYVQAQVGFKDNQKAKDFQFRWNPDRKVWWKGIKAQDFKEESLKYDFQYNMLLTAPE